MNIEIVLSIFVVAVVAFAAIVAGSFKRVYAGIRMLEERVNRISDTLSNVHFPPMEHSPLGGYPSEPVLVSVRTLDQTLAPYAALLARLGYKWVAPTTQPWRLEPADVPQKTLWPDPMMATPPEYSCKSSQDSYGSSLSPRGDSVTGMSTPRERETASQFLKRTKSAGRRTRRQRG